MNLEEIDRLVAEKVMGYSRITPSGNVSKVSYYEFRDGRYTYARRINSFQPTWYMEDSWLVVEKFVDKGYLFTLKNINNGDYCFSLINWNDNCDIYESIARTAPLAICLTALKVVGIEIDMKKPEGSTR